MAVIGKREPLPTARAVDLPSSVRQYLTPGEAPDFKVDEFIVSLS